MFFKIWKRYFLTLPTIPPVHFHPPHPIPRHTHTVYAGDGGWGGGGRGGGNEYYYPDMQTQFKNFAIVEPDQIQN